MAIKGIQPSSQGVGDTTSMAVTELTGLEVGKVQATNNISGQSVQTTGIVTEKQQPTDEQLDKKLKDAISMANNKMKQSQPQTRCEFTFHEEMNRVSIKLIDKDTDKVVKEIPPEKTIKMIEKLWEVAGLLIDQKL